MLYYINHYYQSWTALHIPDDGLRNDQLHRFSIFNAFEGKLYIVACRYKGLHLRAEGRYMGSCKREIKCIYTEVWCVIENVIYCCIYTRYCMWCDVKGREW